ncbi:carboxy terminal-processing peptidase [Marinimicrobium sp. ABcell2]|uniref:carboxy terminal-processing peptidase n=1 Tax=Marinimicrobium sp. ABcell2 TaxID=3069751 RepID=UPI00359C4712
MQIVSKPLFKWSGLCALLVAAQLAFAAAVEPLQYTQQHQKTTAEIVQQLTQKHYRGQALDDSVSVQYLNNYLRGLDPAKSFFFQADIDAFEAHKDKFDDYLKKGDLKVPFEIFNVYRQRLTTRLESVIAELESEDISFDFEKDEVLVTDWDKAEWPKDKKTADELWRKRIKSNLLSLKLAGTDIEEGKEILHRRFTNQLRRAKQQDQEDAFGVIINSLTTLYDPHTNYLSPRTLENFNINMSLSLEGIGAVLQTEDEYTKVMRLVPAGPADKQGQLRPADRIVAVGQGEEGEMMDIIGLRLDEVVEQIRGPKNTVVRLRVLPANAAADSSTKTIRITREKVKLEEQAAQKDVFELRDNDQTFKLGIIKVPTFYMDFEAYRKRDPEYKSTTRDVYRLLQELEKENVDGIIVDLRSNGGGSLQEATTLTDLFIDQGPVVQIRQTNEMISRNFRSHSRAAYRGPIVVLIDRMSASASEIFAGAIQDYGRGIVIGTPTFGKGTVQSLIPLNKGQLKITESKFYRVSGESTQHRGVVPDLELPSMVNINQVGEGTYDYALPWDKIHRVPHATYFDIEALLPELRGRHDQRTERDPDLRFLAKQRALLEENDDRTSVSLNKQQRRAEQHSLEERMLVLENERRKAKGLEPYKSYAAIRDNGSADTEEDSAAAELEAHRSGAIDPYNDPFLSAAGHALIDFIQLNRKLEESDKVANF